MKSSRECASNKTSGATTRFTCLITRLKEEALTAGLSSRALFQEIQGQADLLRLINCGSQWYLMSLDNIATTLTISYLKCKFSSSNHLHHNNCSKLRTNPAKTWLRQCLANPNPPTSKFPSQITTVIRLPCVRSSQTHRLSKTLRMPTTVTTQCPSKECKKLKHTTKTCSHQSTNPRATITLQTQPQPYTNNPTSKDSSETQSLFQINKKRSRSRSRAKKMSGQISTTKTRLRKRIHLKLQKGQCLSLIEILSLTIRMVT